MKLALLFALAVALQAADPVVPAMDSQLVVLSETSPQVSAMNPKPSLYPVYLAFIRTANPETAVVLIQVAYANGKRSVYVVPDLATAPQKDGWYKVQIETTADIVSDITLTPLLAGPAKRVGP